MSEIDEALAHVAHEGEKPFANTEKDTPTDSPTVKEPKDAVQKEEPKEGENTPEKEVPFHEHPRWKQREEELKTLREAEEAHAREIEELKAFREESKTSKTTAIPDWFKELYGDNEVAWAKYSEHDRVQRDDIKREVLQEQELLRQRQTDEANRWNKWVDDQITKLQADGKQFDRNKLIKTMLEYRPTDDNNNFDFEKGYRIYEALEQKEADPQKSQERKQLADIVTATTKGDKKSKDFLTAHDLRNKSWNNL